MRGSTRGKPTDRSGLYVFQPFFRFYFPSESVFMLFFVFLFRPSSLVSSVCQPFVFFRLFSRALLGFVRFLSCFSCSVLVSHFSSVSLFFSSIFSKLENEE